MSAADEWDFYLCHVDDRPASIWLNLRYEEVIPPASAGTLYWLCIHMLDAEQHGMGASAEAETLHRVEDQLVSQAASSGLVYVGRLRNDGDWQLTFYGPPDRDEALDALARVADLGARSFEVGTKEDPTWSYYRDFLLPDGARREWMRDRRTVDALEEHGDVLATPRRVDHWAYFPSAAARQAFVERAARDGFALEHVWEDAAAARPFGAQIFRTDAVELEAIHQVVMELRGLADEHGGSYDGWECPVTTSS